jgi:AraC family transcriptional regulator
MKIAIVDRLPVRVAYLRYTGPYGEALGKFWRATVAPWLAEHGMVDCPRYGVPLDDSMNTPPDKCRYDACVELPAGMSLPGAEKKIIDGGKYAVTTFKGTGAGIGPAWGAFVAECLAGKTPAIDATRLPFEHYPRGTLLDPKSGVFACEFFLPVSS